MWPEEFGKEIKIQGILISKNFKVLCYTQFELEQCVFNARSLD